MSPDNSPRNRRPLVVALEGLDGTGKSLHAQQLAEMAMGWGLRVSVYSYTGSRDDFWGQIIRSIYKSGGQDHVKQLLSRSRLLQELVFSHQARLNLNDLGRLDEHDLVICDRCAVTAFVAHRRLIGSTWIAEWLLTLLEIRFVPDYVIYLKTSPETALARISARSKGRWRDENVSLLTNMEARYTTLVERRRVPWLFKNVVWYVINAEDELASVGKKLQVILRTILIAEGVL